MNYFLSNNSEFRNYVLSQIDYPSSKPPSLSFIVVSSVHAKSAEYISIEAMKANAGVSRNTLWIWAEIARYSNV